MRRYKYELILFASSILYGSSYAFMPILAQYVEPFTANTMKAFFGVLILIPFSVKNKLKLDSNLLKGSAWLSFTLFSANYLLQFVSDHIDAGKSGFISSLYVVLVPVFAFIFKGTKQSLKTWLSVLIATFGLYLLFDFKGGFTFSIYDFAILLVPIIFVIEIFAIYKYTQLTDPVHMSAVAMLFVLVYNLICALFFETVEMANVIKGIPVAFYLGGPALGLAILLQTSSQKYLNEVLASIIMSLESVISVIFGYLILSQNLSLKEIVGCLLMFAGTILCQIFTDQK